MNASTMTPADHIADLENVLAGIDRRIATADMYIGQIERGGTIKAHQWAVVSSLHIDRMAFSIPTGGTGTPFAVGMRDMPTLWERATAEEIAAVFNVELGLGAIETLRIVHESEWWPAHRAELVKARDCATNAIERLRSIAHMHPIAAN